MIFIEAITLKLLNFLRAAKFFLAESIYFWKR